MFGTAIAVFDGYARSVKRCSELIFGVKENNKSVYPLALIVVGVVSYIIIFVFSNKPSGFKALIDLATTISFLIAPLIAFVNFRLVGKDFISADAVPKTWLKVLSWLGLLFLTGFSILFIVIKLT